MVERVPEHVEEVGKVDLAVEAGLDLLDKTEDDEEGVADGQNVEKERKKNPSLAIYEQT